MSHIYLDYNATTPLDEEVFQSMVPHMKNFYGNPSSIHQIGRQAKAHLDDFRYDVSEMWHVRHELETLGSLIRLKRVVFVG